MCAGAIFPKDAPAQSPGCAGSHGRGTLGGCACACSACARASAQPATSAQCFLVCSTVHPSFLTPVDICPDHRGERMGLASCARALWPAARTVRQIGIPRFMRRARWRCARQGVSVCAKIFSVLAEHRSAMQTTALSSGRKRIEKEHLPRSCTGCVLMPRYR